MVGNEPTEQETAEQTEYRSRKANRRTLKGCATRLEAIQGDIRKVGIQYAERNTTVFKALHFQHTVIDEIKKGLDRAGNAL